MSWSHGIASVLVAVLAALTATADADVVELVNGERVDGNLVRVTGDLVVVEVAGNTVTLARLRVRAIYLTPAPHAASPAVPRTDVLAALQHLRSVAASRIEHDEYVRQVAQRRGLIERYLQEPGSASAALTDAIRDALAFYEFAAAAWASRLTNSASGSATIGRSPLIDRCPALQRLVGEYPPPTTQESAWRRGVVLEFALTTIWGCASEKVADAERASQP